jgi:GxxExxY protein
MKVMADVIYRQESYNIIGACFEVYNQKGFGFTEPVYQECLEIEFEIQKIPFAAQPKIELEYKGRMLNQFFVPDFICFGKIIVEIKSVSKLADGHIAQTLNYLNATKFELAWLVNFGQYGGLERKRIVNERNKYKSLRDEMQSWI